MGNSLKKQKEALLAANNTKKSKGERLGWKSISEYKTVSLKEIGLSLKPWGIALKFLFLHHENILFPND